MREEKSTIKREVQHQKTQVEWTDKLHALRPLPRDTIQDDAYIKSRDETSVRETFGVGENAHVRSPVVDPTLARELGLSLSD